MELSPWVSGVQWLFFMFTNTVVIPITIGAAFSLPQESIVTLMQYSFIVTGIACVIQAASGHKRAIMEGQSGLWWGVILSLAAIAPAQGIPIETVGGSLVVGIIMSGILTLIIGIVGAGPLISKLFNSNVMGVFMFLFGCQILGIFLQGMLGIPFGNQTSETEVAIDLPISLLSIIIVLIVIIISAKAPAKYRPYGLLIGILIGWLAYNLLFSAEATVTNITGFQFDIFILGAPDFHWGIILTAVVTGLLNLANTFGSLKGTEPLYNIDTTKSDYRRSFSITGTTTTIAGVIGLVPYAPYVSSIGFLSQTRILQTLPFMLAGVMFVSVGAVPLFASIFATIPLSVGSAVLFVAYLQLFLSAFGFFKQIDYTSTNVYRTAIPVFTGVIIMTMPGTYFSSLPELWQPLLSNGLLVGLILAIVLEMVIPWDRERES
ncbi:uracil/xanthine transporter [Salicibibacter cibarius]|uniref:Uracil/xanthine transporter n=2 Tax=Salicibibacter cibarius TaxID=2743000 RepID=A0A7T6Z7G2_9BACI|nr:uracil/xanthine transporter [Salicibibacter cibarius]